MAVEGLLMLPKPPKGDKADDIDEDVGSVGKKACAEDLIDAFKRGDSKALIAALDDYLEIWGGPAPAEDDSEDVE